MVIWFTVESAKNLQKDETTSARAAWRHASLFEVAVRWFAQERGECAGIFDLHRFLDFFGQPLGVIHELLDVNVLGKCFDERTHVHSNLQHCQAFFGTQMCALLKITSASTASSSGGRPKDDTGSTEGADDILVGAETKTIVNSR